MVSIIFISYWYISASKVTCCGLNDQGMIPGGGRRIFLFSFVSYQNSLLHGVKQPEWPANYLLTSQIFHGYSRQMTG